MPLVIIVRQNPSGNEIFGQNIFLLSATKLWQGNIFTPVCQSFHSQGGLPYTSHGQTDPPWADPPGQTPTWADTTLGRHPHPLDRHPHGQTPPMGRHPPCTVHAGMQSTSMQYASYIQSLSLALNLQIDYIF